MVITYRIFGNKKGVLLNRKPLRIEDTVTFVFEGAEDNLTCILKNQQGDSLYRPINDGVSEIPSKFINGRISVIVADLNNSIEKKYKCEGLVSSDGWVMPEGLDLPLEIAEAQEQVDKLIKAHEELKLEIKRLRDEYRGYEVI